MTDAERQFSVLPEWRQRWMLLQAMVGASSVAAEATVTNQTITASGSVAAGKLSIQFVFSPDFAGTIGGVAYNGANDFVWAAEALPNGTRYAALAYTVTAGSARLTTVA